MTHDASMGASESLRSRFEACTDRSLLMRMRPVLVIATAALLALVPSAALAHYPEIEGEQDCHGLVKFTATAWNEDEATPEKRTNNDVHVKILEAGEHGHRADPIAEFDDHFGPDNGFGFSGQHRLDEPREVVIKVTAKVKWGPNEDLAEAGESRWTKVRPPSDCDQDEQTTTSESTSTTEAPEDTDATGSTGSTVGPQTTSPPPTTVGAAVIVDVDQTPAGSTEDDLPFTGASATIPMLVGGIALIGAGVFAVRFGRRHPADVPRPSSDQSGPTS
jgi:hypothetical protein